MFWMSLKLPVEPDDVWSMDYDYGPVSRCEVVVDGDKMYFTMEVLEEPAGVRVMDTHVQLWFEEGIYELNYPKGIRVDRGTAKYVIRNGIIDIVAKILRRSF